MTEELKRLAIEAYPSEACAFICGEKVVPVPNRHKCPNDAFEVDHEDMERVEAEHGRVTGFFHSHPDGPNCPSGEDMQAQRALGVPFWICCSNGVEATKPFSWGGDDRPPLVGRPFRHGVTDCYSLIRDFYRQRFGIDLPDYPRDWEWWTKGENLYMENLSKKPWRRVDPSEVKEGDIGIFKVGRTKDPNHGAVYLGRSMGLMLHHLSGRESYDPSRLSVRVPVARWARYLVGWYRHEEV